jgi:hypothetical protein
VATEARVSEYGWRATMTIDEALSFIREHGIVLVSGKGPVPRLVEVIAGEPIKGSWWAHPKSHQIFAVLEKLGDSPDLLACRLVDGKVTFVHRRLWSTLVKLSKRFQPDQLAQVRQEHTPSGQHVNHYVPFPSWVPRDALEEAEALSDDEACRRIGPLLEKSPPTRPPRRSLSVRKATRRRR